MKKYLILFICICLLYTAIILITEDKPYDFTVYFLDVGQGDSAVVTANGHTMLIDGGNADASDKIYAFLKEKKIDRIDYMVATHAHDDHTGGLPAALEAAQVGTVLSPAAESDGVRFNVLKRKTEEKGLSLTLTKAGDSFKLGRAKVQVLMPVEGEPGTGNTSIVLRITYGKHSFLFMGDSEDIDEKVLLAHGENIGSTVVKIGHHGSNTSTSKEFLAAVSPQYAVISVGASNDFGHPSAQVLKDIRLSGISLYRTDMQGTVTCKSNGKDIIFSVERNKNAVTYDYPGGYKNTLNKTFITDEAANEVRQFIVNKRTGVIHKDNCEYGPTEKNRLPVEGTIRDLMQQYKPCSRCHPDRP